MKDRGNDGFYPNGNFQDQFKFNEDVLLESLYFRKGVVSVIVPCYNERENITPFMRELSAVDVSPYTKEIIIINDGSDDGSAEILNNLKKRIPDLTVLNFPRNFGQQQALLAGIRMAMGEILVTIDMDLQQPPSLIPEMIRKYEQGYQVVHAIPEYRQSATLLKMITSKLYYRMLGILGGNRVVYKSNEFRLFSHRIAKVLRSVPESSLYLRGIIMWLCPLEVNTEDQKVPLSGRWLATTVKYHHRSRVNGKTKYSYLQLMALAFDGLTAVTIQPLRFGLLLGMISVGLAGILSIWALYMRLLTSETVSGWTSLMIVVLFFCSVQFILLGVIGEYIGKIYLHIRERPGHIIEWSSNRHSVGTLGSKSSNQKLNNNTNF